MSEYDYPKLFQQVSTRVGDSERAEHIVLESLLAANQANNGENGWPTTESFIGIARHLADKYKGADPERSALFTKAASLAEGTYYVDPLDSDGRYSVKGYEVPVAGEKAHLPTFDALLKEFNDRFLNYVDRGHTLRKINDADMDKLIERERAKYEDETLPQARRDLAGIWYKTALLNRSAANARKHIQLRMNINEAEPDPKVLDALQTKFLEDWFAAEAIPLELRTKGGVVERDTIFDEMLGEPRKIFQASLPESFPEAMEGFFNTRYGKVAKAKRVIEHTVKAILPLARDYHPDMELPLLQMAVNAMLKIELQRGVDKDYPEADQSHIAYRNVVRKIISDKQVTLQAAVSPHGHVGRMNSVQTARISALNFIEKGCDIIRDMAITRDDMPKALQWLQTSIRAAGLGRLKASPAL